MAFKNLFSTNQKLELSGKLDSNIIKTALDFALQHSNTDPELMTFQITKSGDFCIGWAETSKWFDFQFEPDSDVVSYIIKKHLEKQKYDYTAVEDMDGSYYKGFLMQSMSSYRETHKDHGNIYEVIDPSYCVVVFSPYVVFYHK